VLQLGDHFLNLGQRLSYDVDKAAGQDLRPVAKFVSGFRRLGLDCEFEMH
jgi:hypothetical protein